MGMIDFVSDRLGYGKIHAELIADGLPILRSRIEVGLRGARELLRRTALVVLRDGTA